jgi:hypothetical protein
MAFAASPGPRNTSITVPCSTGCEPWRRVQRGTTPMPFDYFDTDEQLSARLSLSPEGFLRVKNAVLARTGSQQYHATEVPTLDADGDGWVDVDRPDEEVFHPRSLQSYIGKPVCMTHPSDMIGPHNARQLTVGHVVSARRGEGADSDCVVGDLFITDQRAIEGIRSGAWRSLSAGYDARYIQHARGRASQADITINHVALLPTGQARCGPRCMIQDSKPSRRQKMRRTRDQTVIGEHNAWANDPTLKNRSSTMGDEPGPVGPSLVMTLPGHSSNYFILDLGPNKVGVVCSSEIAGKLDMAVIAEGRGLPHVAAGRAMDAAMIRQQRDADEARQRAQLREINAANRRFWSTNA